MRHTYVTTRTYKKRSMSEYPCYRTKSLWNHDNPKRYPGLQPRVYLPFRVNLAAGHRTEPWDAADVSAVGASFRWLTPAGRPDGSGRRGAREETSALQQARRAGTGSRNRAPIKRVSVRTAHCFCFIHDITPALQDRSVHTYLQRD